MDLLTANEIELTWSQPIDSMSDESLTINVRREVRHLHMTPPPEGD